MINFIRAKISPWVFAIGGLFHFAAQADDSALTVSKQTGCTVLPNNNCEGKQQKLSYQFSSGYYVDLENRIENGSAQTDKLAQIFLFGSVDSKFSLKDSSKATNIRFGKAFHPTSGSSINVEAYGGHISAEARANGSINIDSPFLSGLGPSSPITPPPSSGAPSAPPSSGNMPSSPSTSTPSSSSPSSYAPSSSSGVPVPSVMQPSSNQPSTNQTKGLLFAVNQGKKISTPYGGVSLTAGTGLPVTERLQVILNGKGNVGFDRIGYGAGVGLAITSSPDPQLGSKVSNLCNRGMLSSSARFAFGVTLCADKTTYDAVYNQFENDSKTLATSLNDAINPLRELALQQLGTKLPIATYTGQDIMNRFGIVSPYHKTNLAVVFSGAVKITEQASVLASYTSHRSGEKTGAVALSYSF